MSSSIFIESSAVAEDGNKGKQPDSNLVVVYGKNSVNIDPKDLETLIEEKAVQTISVIRISSPTPSMEEAEDAERLQAAKEAQEETAESEDGTDRETTESKRWDTAGAANNESTEDESNSSDADQNIGNRNEESSDGNEKLEKSSEKAIRRHRNKRQNAMKKKNKTVCKKQEIKHDTEVMGLTLEGFYEAEAALEIAKEACKMAGIPYIKNTAEYEFMLLVIRNDHCYTPYTSPEQMKEKIAAEKLEAEKLAANVRKLQPQFVTPSQQILTKTKKLSLTPNMAISLTNKISLKKPFGEVKKLRATKGKSNFGSILDSDDYDEDGADLKQPKPLNILDGEQAKDDEDETFELIDVDDSDYTGSDQSADSDNDRDSDLDFNVNHRQTKKRRIPLAQKKTKRLFNARIQDKQRQQDERSSIEDAPTSSTRKNNSPSTSTISLNTPQRQLLVKSRGLSNNISKNSRQIINPMGKLHHVQAAGGSVQTLAGKTITKSTATPLLPGQIGDDSLVATGRNNVAKAGQPTMQPAVKEIVINKVLSSPKGCFTELTTLISEAEKTNVSHTLTHMESQPVTPTTSVSRNAGLTTPSRTCFMRIDATGKNALPSQISVETHQSSSELLAAEHDKQLDLIDSIVTDELNKSLENFSEKPSISADENIPKLVQMLENTEKALESKSFVSKQVTTPNILETCMSTSADVNDNTNTTNVDDIDISHDLPEDLLQHVVELIKDDKTLQEAVEKEILEQEGNFVSDALAATTSLTHQRQHHQTKIATGSHSNVRTIQILQPNSERSPPMTPPLLPTSTSKSIIQMSISNTTNSSPVGITTTISSGLPRSSPLARRDPIQIVRGNGRVITLPPIEAPTTRAKRRAQVIPNTGQQSVENSPQILNESSLDNSLQSNASFNAISIPTTPVSSTGGLGTILDTPVEKKTRETSAIRRTSKEGLTTTSKSSKKSGGNKSSTVKLNTSKQNDTEISESQGDDDDPRRLWCICRQPHNNRFMICCDACSDWFHGTCVNVTKAMGREMELKGIEWSCPNCIKKREERTQRKLTDMLQVRRTNSQTSIDEKIKTTTDISEAGFKKETQSEYKKVAYTPQAIVQTPTSRKIPIVVQSHKKVIATTSTNSSGSQNKTKALLTSPVRIVSTMPNSVTKQTQLQTSRANNNPVITNTTTNTSAPLNPCALCKKQGSRPNSVYCSDECIRRSAQNAINAYSAKSIEQNETAINSINTQEDKKKRARGLFEDLLSMADRKPRVERIVVYDRRSGTKLSGSNAPTTLTIKKWLHENPNFEVVLPGSQLSVEIEKQQQRPQMIPKHVGQIRTLNPKAMITTASTNRLNSLPSQSPINQDQISSTTKEISGIQGIAVSPPAIKSVKQMIEEHKNPSSSNSSRPNTPRQLQKYPQHVQIRPDNKSPRNETKDENKPKERQLKRQSSDVSTGGGTSSNNGSSTKKYADSAASSAAAATSSDTEPIRKNVRRTLKEQLLQRMNEAPITSTDGNNDTPSSIRRSELKLTPQEVEAFVKETEAEMFNMFNRETGVKYKAKYRSLIFNIKDRKNHTLFAKICAKQIEPKQLVHMSPEELASQELAQWRQNENKHQLEMIKKSELDLLSCTKNYLFKNHKGEEVIESKQSDVCVNLDMTIPVEDVVNVLNSSGNNEVDIANISNLDSSLGKSGLKQQHVSPQRNSGSIDLYETYTPEHLRHIQKEYESIDEKGDEERPKTSHSGVEKDRDSRGRDRRHRSKSRDSEKEGRHRSRSKDSKEFEKERERGRDRRYRSRERHHRDKSRAKRKSHSRSKSRGRSEEKRYKEQKEERRDRDRDKEEKERSKEKKPNSNKSISIELVKSKEKEKHRNSPTATSSTKANKQPQIQQQKAVECFNLIDQIIESSKTVEEAANLVRDSGKDKTREKEKPKEPQSPVIATSSMDTITPTQSKTTTKIGTTTQCNSSTADSDQEPSSTVSIPTPPHDSYAGEGDEEEPSFSRPGSPNMEATQIWSGGLVMNEVATLQIKLHHLIGNSRNIGRYLTEFLDVVGRIDNETVWEYLSKIRNSPNKEIVLLRLMPYRDDDKEAYGKLFQYLDQKKRLGVIKSMTPQIKDFYFFPLRAGKQLPKVLQVMNHEDFSNDPNRPDMIIGIIVRVLGKRISANNPSSIPVTVSSTSTKGSIARRVRNDPESFTPPGSPKRRKRNNKGDIDVDAIIKAPIVARTVQRPTSSATVIDADADEPYSPGGSSDDDVLPQYSAKSSSSLLLGLPSADEDLKRKMEEINRQIAAQEMEIAGLLNVEPNSSASVLANISIPSNLPQILASIKSKDAPGRGNFAPQLMGDRIPQASDSFDEYNPEDSIRTTYSSSARHSLNTPSSSTSRLAQLSEAELLSMVPDDIVLDPAPTLSAKKSATYYQEPPPPGI